MKLDFSNRNLWIGIIIIIIVVLITTYVLLNASPEEEIKVYDVNKILESPTDYLDKIISVEGYYYHDVYPAGEGLISSELISEGQSSTTFLKYLKVNHININLSLADRIKYRFIGVLQIDDTIPGESYTFIAEDIVEV